MVAGLFVAVRSPARHDVGTLGVVRNREDERQQSAGEIWPDHDQSRRLTMGLGELIEHCSRVLLKIFGWTRPHFLSIKVREAVLPEMVVDPLSWQQASIWNVNHRSTLAAVTVKPNSRHDHDWQAF